MYHPYFRGKQNELIVMRDNAELIATAGVVPIIEPVKKNLKPLERSLAALKDNVASFILIINPKIGDLKNNNTSLNDLVSSPSLVSYENMFIGYVVNASSNLVDITSFLDDYKDSFKIAIVHDGFPDASALKSSLDNYTCVKKHIFIEESSGNLYMDKFKTSERVLIRDGFKQQVRNSDHPDNELFSELHLTYDSLGMDGFGDYLIVGNSFRESGGPAYTVAIHLTYFGLEEVMYLRHFKSEPSNTPVNPAGKFLEALNALIDGLTDGSVPNTKAILEFRDLYERGHFPGLGSVKKLSMQHHVELLSQFLLEK